jgi:DNA-binding transcriptional ArsR family regulator
MTDEPVDRVFSALSDPTRRAVIRCLADGGPATLGSLADELPVTRQAVAKHLAQLEDAGLVSARADGRRRTYRLTPGPRAPLTSVSGLHSRSRARASRRTGSR